MKKQMVVKGTEKKPYAFSVLNPRPSRKNSRKYPPSPVVPDRNMTMSVIMQKYAGGQHRGQQPHFTDPEMMDYVQGIDARKLSMCELHQRITENKKRLETIQTELQVQQMEKQRIENQRLQEKYREQIRNEVKNELKKEATPQH